MNTDLVPLVKCKETIEAGRYLRRITRACPPGTLPLCRDSPLKRTTAGITRAYPFERPPRARGGRQHPAAPTAFPPLACPASLPLKMFTALRKPTVSPSNPTVDQALAVFLANVRRQILRNPWSVWLELGDVSPDPILFSTTTTTTWFCRVQHVVAGYFGPGGRRGPSPKTRGSRHSARRPGNSATGMRTD
jgi:hypothetical protein